MWTNIIGWAASTILVATIGYQVLRQWRAGTSKGVSRYLFVGQLIASSLFTVYSIMLGSTVFIVTNAILGLSAIVGLVIVILHKRREGSPEAVDGRDQATPQANAAPM